MSHPSNDRQAAIKAAAPKRSGSNPVAWIAAAVVLLLLAGGIVFAVLQNNKSKDAGNNTSAAAPPSANSDKSGIIVNKSKVAAGAPVVALWQDYQCPACKQFEDTFGGALEELSSQGKIQLEYHTMTFLDAKWGTQASIKAAQAAACADTVGTYAKYHDVVYKHQVDEREEIKGNSYTDDQLLNSFPKEAGITGGDLTKFQSCVKANTMKDWVAAVNEKANQANITSTPTVRVNGKDFELKGFTSAEDFKKKLLAAGGK